jgi:hypothetical protein
MSLSVRMTATLACSLILGAGLTPASASDENTYTINGLDSYIVKTTTFTVSVSGSREVCSMKFLGNEILTPPWRFVLDPAKVNYDIGSVTVFLCDGTWDVVELPTALPWVLSRRLAIREADGFARAFVSSLVGEPATVKVLSLSGKTLGSAVLAGQGVAEIRFKAKSTAPLTMYRLKIVGSRSGLEMEMNLPGAYRWATTRADGPTYQLCSTVYWFYDASHEPSTANAMLSDISGALARLSPLTGLKFVQVKSRDSLPATNFLTVDWSFKGLSQVGGEGGSRNDGYGVQGVVALNTKNWKARSDAYKGFGYVRAPKATAGRGWLLVHEIMHTMGLGHTSAKSQVMYPFLGRQTSFGVGDKAGLNYLYRPQSCN